MRSGLPGAMPLASTALVEKNRMWPVARAVAMTSVRAPTSEDISAKAPTTGTRTWGPCDFISFVMGPSAPSGVPS